jgi:hypothetical protein
MDKPLLDELEAGARKEVRNACDRARAARSLFSDLLPMRPGIMSGHRTNPPIHRHHL